MTWKSKKNKLHIPDQWSKAKSNSNDLVEHTMARTSLHMVKPAFKSKVMSFLSCVIFYLPVKIT